MKKYLIVLLLVSSFGFGQNLNEYKYALVPAKFSFLKEVNMYNLNVLTKLYMQRYGFETYFDNETFPADFASNNCNKVFIDVINNSNVFTTKLSVVIKDCKNTILFTSGEGKSNEKEYNVAYNLALREAFDNFTVLKNHKYVNTEKKVEDTKVAVVETKSESPKAQETKNSIQYSEPLFAKPFGENGFQLLTNNTNVPQYVMTIYKTSSSDCYIASKEDNSGVLIKKMSNWFFEYYKDGKLISQPILIVNF